MLTHNATSLILPGSANITTTAGDTAEFLSLGGGNWICLNYSYQLIGKPLDAALADFAIVYPNGGTQASPANITVNTRYTVANPFPGFRVICTLQVLYGGNWGDPGTASWTDASTNTIQSWGSKASQLGDNSIVVQVGTTGLLVGGGSVPCHPFGNITNQSTLPARVLVWKLRGAV